MSHNLNPIQYSNYSHTNQSQTCASKFQPSTIVTDCSFGLYMSRYHNRVSPIS
jgi:hypothetical protein